MGTPPLDDVSLVPVVGKQREEEKKKILTSVEVLDGIIIHSFIVCAQDRNEKPVISGNQEIDIEALGIIMEREGVGRKTTTK